MFEFVEGDCELEVSQSEAAASASAPSEIPSPLGRAILRRTASATVELPAEAMRRGAGRLAAAGRQRTIRVDLDRVDRLIDLVGELVINQAMLAQRVGEAGLARPSASATALDELGAADARASRTA